MADAMKIGDIPACDEVRSWFYLRKPIAARVQAPEVLGLRRSSARRVGREFLHFRNGDGFSPATTPADLAYIPEKGIIAAVDRNLRRTRRSSQPARAEFPGSNGEPHSRRRSAHAIHPSYPTQHTRGQGYFQTKSDFPFFEGNPHIEDYLDWEQDLEHFFEYMDIPQEKRVRFVVRKLKGRAEVWWNLIIRARRLEGRRDVETWRKMKRLLRGQFLPTDYEQLSYRHYSAVVSIDTGEKVLEVDCKEKRSAKMVDMSTEGFEPVKMDSQAIHLVHKLGDDHKLVTDKDAEVCSGEPKDERLVASLALRKEPFEVPVDLVGGSDQEVGGQVGCGGRDAAVDSHEGISLGLNSKEKESADLVVDLAKEFEDIEASNPAMYSAYGFGGDQIQIIDADAKCLDLNVQLCPGESYAEVKPHSRKPLEVDKKKNEISPNAFTGAFPIQGHHKGVVDVENQVTLKLNRTILVEEDRIKAETESAKAPVDFTTLQLHNLMHEKNHYLKAKKTCRDFRSKYSDIELVPEEEFFKNAPEDIKAKVLASDAAHNLMLKRFNYELFQRKELCKLHEKLEQHKRSLVETIGSRKKFLSSLPSHLKSLKKATLPVQQQLGILHTKKLKQHYAAELLPPPLYIVYSQLLAQKEAFGEKIEMEITGSVKDAQTFSQQQASKENGTSANMENIRLEDDAPDEEEDVQRRRKRSKKNLPKENGDQGGIQQTHPLKVIVHVFDDEDLQAKPPKLMSLKFEYLIKLNVVCVGVEDAEQVSDENILCNLFPNDTGTELPHQTAKLYAGDFVVLGDKSSSRPYMWAQHLAGMDFLPEVPPVQLRSEVLKNEEVRRANVSSGLSLYRHENRVQTVLQRIRSRKKAQMALV